MRIVQINSSNFGSTGNIMLGIAGLCRDKGYKCYTFYPKGRSMIKNFSDNHFFIGSRVSRNLHLFFGKLTGLKGFFSVLATFFLVKKIKSIKPDIIHLHNLHDSYLNIPLLFKYMKDNNAPIVWTLHDCWAFTGKCPHFTTVKCEKWKYGCNHCPLLKEYPQICIDTTRITWKCKKRWFANLDNLHIVTPSKWLGNLVKESFLKECSTHVIYNGIDCNIFKPTISDFRKNYNCKDKYIVLGVAFGWGNKKGLDTIIELSRSLPDNYQIVLVGTDESIDRMLPNNIISIHRVADKVNLAEIYSAADVFINPTKEEVLGMVNIEALACGTPVITFKTGGSPETIDSTTGAVVESNSTKQMENEIIRICTTRPYHKESCINRAREFDMGKKYLEYLKLYEEICRGF